MSELDRESDVVGEPSLEAVEPSVSGSVPAPGRAVGVAVAFGLLVAAFELVALGAGLAMPLSPGRWVLLGVGIAVLDGGLAALIAWPVVAAAGRVDAAVAAVVATLGLACVVPGIARAGAEEQTLSLLVLAAVPLVLAAAAALQARVLSRSRLPVVRAAALVVLVAVGVAAVLNREDPVVGTVAADRPSIVVVTVDGWGAGRSVPALEALAAGGVTFTDAVTPTPGSRAANATVLAGLHPLRHHVLDDGDLLSRGYRTLFEALADLGYPTAAFVSSGAAEAGSGLDQGFSRFDDGTTLLRLPAVGRLAVGLLEPIGPGRTRSGADTAEAFARWVDGRTGPFAVWIHLADPHLQEHGAAVNADAELAAAGERIGAALASAGVADSALVVVAGTHGELAGAHRGTGNRTLYDAVVHVPLRIRFPGPAPQVPEVGVQVRLMDIASSVLDGAGFDALAESEGVPLIAYGTGFRKATISCGLVGRGLHDGWLLGLRNNGVKVVVPVGGGDGSAWGEEVYLLATDPEEQQNRASDQEAVLGQVRGMLGSDRAALLELVR